MLRSLLFSPYPKEIHYDSPEGFLNRGLFLFEFLFPGGSYRGALFFGLFRYPLFVKAHSRWPFVPFSSLSLSKLMFEC